MDFLVGSTRSGLPIGPAFYGCMHQYREVGTGAWVFGWDAVWRLV